MVFKKNTTPNKIQTQRSSYSNKGTLSLFSKSDKPIFSSITKGIWNEKIIILSDTNNPRFGLVSQLKELFPECEIQIVQRHPKSNEEDMITESTVINLLGESVI